MVDDIVAADGHDGDGFSSVVFAYGRETFLDMLHIRAMGADKHHQQSLLSAEIVATDGLAGDNIGERKIGGRGAKFQHGGFSKCHWESPDERDCWGSWFPTLFAKNANRMGHPASLLKQWCLAAGHGEAEVLVSQASGHAAARGAVEESDLDEKWFVDLFERVLFLGQGCCQGAQADGAAVVFLDDGEQ